MLARRVFLFFRRPRLRFSRMNQKLVIVLALVGVAARIVPRFVGDFRGRGMWYGTRVPWYVPVAPSSRHPLPHTLACAPPLPPPPVCNVACLCHFRRRGRLVCGTERECHGTPRFLAALSLTPPWLTQQPPRVCATCLACFVPGAAENASPVVTHTPSPPVARRTRSKSPASIKQANVGELGLASPRPTASVKNKRSLTSISASPASKVKETARG